MPAKLASYHCLRQTPAQKTLSLFPRLFSLALRGAALSILAFFYLCLLSVVAAGNDSSVIVIISGQ